MTKLLEKAFAAVAKLPAQDQDAFADFLLAELQSEERWTRAFASSSDELARLAEEALAEHRAGRTGEL